jgi:menaquinone-dependent protoporphyrinogen IX oxidase
MKAKRIILVSILVVITTGIFAIDVFACGDSLYRVGKGVSYRVYTAPLPGSVLVYGESEGAQQLAEALAQSGHGVRLVSSTEELETELQNGDYDVVIASYSEHEAVESSRSLTTASQVTYLPVAVDSNEESLAKQDYDRVMVADQDEIKHYLKAIHKTLKSKT